MSPVAIRRHPNTPRGGFLPRAARQISNSMTDPSLFRPCHLQWRGLLGLVDGRGFVREVWVLPQISGSGVDSAPEPHFVMVTDPGRLPGAAGAAGLCPACCCQGEGSRWASGWPGRAGQPGVWRVPLSSWPGQAAARVPGRRAGSGEVSHGLDHGHAKAGGRDRVAAVADDREQQRVTPAGWAGDRPGWAAGGRRVGARLAACWPARCSIGPVTRGSMFHRAG